MSIGPKWFQLRDRKASTMRYIAKNSRAKAPNLSLGQNNFRPMRIILGLDV